MGFLKAIRFPLFGLLLIAGYAYFVQRGIEPFAMSSERRQGDPKQTSSSAGRRTGYVWFGGYGGK